MGYLQYRLVQDFWTINSSMSLCPSLRKTCFATMLRFHFGVASADLWSAWVTWEQVVKRWRGDLWQGLKGHERVEIAETQNTPWRINGWNLQITHEKKWTWSSKRPWLCSRLIFRGVTFTSQDLGHDFVVMEVIANRSSFETAPGGCRHLL